MKLERSGSGLRSFGIALLLALPPTGMAADSSLDLSARTRLFAARSFLPEDDLIRFGDATPMDQGSADLRITLGGTRGGLDFEIAAEFGVVYDTTGQAFGADRRLLDLGLQQSVGSDLGTRERLDRLWVGADIGAWRLTVGRQAASFGGGLVFQPMDLFNPFSPVEIDRDFKSGDDMVVLTRPFDDGSELSAFVVGRRGKGSGADADAGSGAVRYRGFVGTLAAELMLGVHLADPLAAMSLSGPVGTAVWRTDLVAQQVDGELELSGIANVDWSFVAGDRNVYVFAEYYHSGFGLADPSLAGLQAKPALLQRASRGELFVLGRDYLSLGASMEWHPLVSQSLLLIHEFGDASQLLQTTFDWRPDDISIWQLSLVAPLGDRGEEFGRLVAGARGDGSPLTLGGGERLLLRWSLYF